MSFCDMDCEWDDQFSAISLADYSGSAGLDDRENCRPEDPMLRNLMRAHDFELAISSNSCDGQHKRKLGVPACPLKSETHAFPPQPSHLTKKLRLVPASSNFTSTCKLNPRNLTSF